MCTWEPVNCAFSCMNRCYRWWWRAGRQRDRNRSLTSWDSIEKPDCPIDDFIQMLSFYSDSNLSVFRYNTKSFPLTQHSLMDVRAAEQCWQDQALWSNSSGPVWHKCSDLSVAWRRFSHGMLLLFPLIWSIFFFLQKNRHFDLCVSSLTTYLNPSFFSGDGSCEGSLNGSWSLCFCPHLVSGPHRAFEGRGNVEKKCWCDNQ